MLFRIVIVCVVLAASFAVFEIASTWRFYHSIQTPEASFTVVNDGNQTNLTIVEFMNYDCLYCRATHKVLLDYAKSNPEIRLVVRPVPIVGGYAEEAAEMALAAGVQGKFWEMDQAIVDYQRPPDERFYRETAGLLGIDYDRMKKDAQGDDVQEMVGDNADAIIRAGVEYVPAIMVGKNVYEFDNPLTLNELISMVAAERAR